MATLKELYTTLKSLRDMNLPVDDKLLAAADSLEEKIIKEVCAVPVNEMMQLWAYKDSLDLGYELKASLNLGPPVLETTRFTK